MTSLFEMKVGQQNELWRIFDAAGLSLEQGEAILRQPALAESMIDVVQEQLAPTSKSFDFFVPLLEQLNNCRRWNDEYSLGFTEADFPGYVPDFTWDPQNPLLVMVAVMYLPDKDGVPGYVRTAQLGWEIIQSQHKSHWINSDFKFDSENLRLLADTEARHSPGIRFVKLNLGAHHEPENGRRACDVRGTDSAHAEILMGAGLQLPSWIKAMDGQRVPYVDIAGYQFKWPGPRDFVYVPWLYFFTGLSKVELGTDDEANRSCSASVPVLVD